jgi:hypothetical protein
LRTALLIAALASGCAADPCDGVSGTCLSARVEGNVGMLDQLRIAVSELNTTMSSPVSAGATFGLPVRLAIELPASVGTSAHITVSGELAGSQVASSGAQVVMLNANGKTSHTFTLMGAVGDAGIGDLAVPSDGGGSDMPPPGVVSVLPASSTIPDVPRNGVSGKVTLTFTNNTTAARTATMITESIAGGGPFSPDISSTCPLNMTTMTLQPVPAMSSCTLVMTVKTSKSGTFTDTFTVTLDDGESVMFTLNAKVTPIWVPEFAGGTTTTLYGVWGDTPTDVYAVGADPSSPIWHTNGNGTWNPSGSGLGGLTFYSITGGDATHLWAGSDLGQIFFSSGNQSWASTSNPDAGATGAVRGISAGSPTGGALEAYAVTDADQVMLWNGSIWSLSYTATQPLYAVSTDTVKRGQYSYSTIVGNGGYMGFNGNGCPGFCGLPSPVTTTLRGTWNNGGTEMYAVGDPAAAGGPGTIVHISWAPTGFMPRQEAPGMNGNLTAISGNGANIYVVGALGNRILHSTGNGVWNQITTPNNAEMNGVYAFPSGEVYAVGLNGQVNHLY